MKSRKQGSVKTGSGKKKVPSDVSPSTTLPPLVEGPLRCFLRVTISRVLWTVQKPPTATFVRLRFWGDSSNGSRFFPRDGSTPAQKIIKTTARFQIRCGPKQFTSYLADMGSLMLEVLTKSDHLPVARAQVSGISSLSVLHPISGFYTLVSPTSEKLGELQVSLNLEPLTEAYDSPQTTEISIDRPQATTLSVPTQSKSLGSDSGEKPAGNSGRSTPRGKDYLYFQTAPKDTITDESQENRIPITNRTSMKQPSQEPSDILSVILERGNKLRRAMVASALKCDVDSTQTLKDIPLPLQKDNVQPPSKLPLCPSGMFLQNILHGDSTLKHSDDVAVVTGAQDSPAYMDKRAVDLLIGRMNTSTLPLWDGKESFSEPLSGHSSMSAESELNDPQYDQNLLENLFYKAPMLDNRLDDAETDIQEMVLSRKSQTKNSSLVKQLGRPGPKTNDHPELDPRLGQDDCSIPLSHEQLTLLSMIRLARVTIESLTAPAGCITTPPRKTPSKGKLPRQLQSKKCTFFVEYVFPMAASRRRSVTSDGNVTRAVSNKVTDSVVKFHHQSVFPVNLNKTTVEQWWGTDLTFRIYSRSNNQMKPVVLGKAVHPLRRLLQNKQLSQSISLPVQCVDEIGASDEIGPLSVSLELVTDNKDMSFTKSSSRSQHIDIQWADSEDTRPDVSSPQKPLKAPSRYHSPCVIPHNSWQQVEEDPEVLLHMLLMVPDGKSFNCGTLQAPNIYLNCKLFWSDETVKSVVSWGQTNPSFNFIQVTPVALTHKLLERMKNNVMVVEVWQKTGYSGQDRLLGLVKLPLHRFYMSFRDSKIAHLLLQAQYPVLAVDCYMPVIDVFSGTCKGNLRILLAMGQSEQILALQRTRDEENSLCHLVRPFHLLDHEPYPQIQAGAAQEQTMREHLFVVSVDKINGLTPLQTTVWGEADCYVQYSFPCQESDPAARAVPTLSENNMDVKTFRTDTTLCVPDPVFGHTESHVLVAPDGVPVQRLLLNYLSNQGLNSGGGVQFEVWCRYYYPNVREQLVAKGMLPLSKLCAMVTMQKQQPDEGKMFSLPLLPRTDSPTGHEPQPAGLLNVCIQYKHRIVRPKGQSGRRAASRIVSLLVQVHRASGLQAAARVLSEQNESFERFASVGVNTYVTVQLSFLPENEKKSTRVVTKTFCPEFDHHMELSCNLLVPRSSGETYSLAELLEEASAVFTLWNRDNLNTQSNDVMLGIVTVPLVDLLHKRTGISGWFGVHTPLEISSSLVGGLDITLGFARHTDRELVIKAAQDLGWEMAQNDSWQEDKEAWEVNTRKASVTISLTKAWIPLHCLLLSGQSELQRYTYCYFRYKFYDQEAFCSHKKHPSVVEGTGENQATVNFKNSRTVEMMTTRPFMWYLQDERLEVQLWVAFEKDKTQRPSDTDRLVGSAFVDLSSLAKIHNPKLTVSGVYPLFRCSATNLQGAAVRVSITLTYSSLSRNDNLMDSTNQEEHLSEEMEAADQAPSPTPQQKSCIQCRHEEKSSTHTQMNKDESFPVTIAVDRAMHLNLKACPTAERSEGTPCCCVSYVTADAAEPVYTTVIANTNCPVWDHQHECRLSNQLLVDPQQCLVFKVWHKGETDRVIGFAPVDLSPLLCGFQSVCGWYNITDLTGQCHGQLKVSITPLKWVQDLRGQRKIANEESTKNVLFQPCTLSYQTTAAHSSFPSHISQYPERKISSPDHTDSLFSERSNETVRHNEHVDQLRLYHQRLQEQTASHSVCSSTTADVSPSSSMLFSTLRKKLSELDNIQRYFSHKLSPPIFQSVSEPECWSKGEEQRNSEKDSSQLFLKSNHSVGNVNYIIEDLRGRHREMTSSKPQSTSATFYVTDNTPHTVPEPISSPHRPSVPSPEFTSHSQTPLPQLSVGRTDYEAEDEKESLVGQATVIEDVDAEETDEDEDGSGGRMVEEVDVDYDGEEDEDYDEVVLKPRHLNELTSLTDKTSPWTSVLSDPELVSPGSSEATDLVQTDQSQNKEHRLTPCSENLSAQTSSGNHESSGREESVSADEDSDVNGYGDRTLETVNEEQAKELNSPSTESNDTHLSPTTQHVTAADKSLGSPDTQDLKIQLSVPNFFLPSHQLEASLKAIRLAPSFSQSSSVTEQMGPGHSVLRRGPRQCPNMSPSSLKKETERRAKIFAAQFE